MELLIDVYPLMLKLILGGILALLILKRGYLKKEFSGISNWAWAAILVIFLISLGVRMFVIPETHLVYFDEFEHNNIAQNILYSGRFCVCNSGTRDNCETCSMLGWPAGYPVFMSLFIGAFGDSENVFFNTNAFIGALSAVLVFLLIHLMSKSQLAAILGSIMFSFIPVHMRFSAATSTEIVSVFFVLLSMIFLEIYLSKKDDYSLGLFLLATIYAVNCRPENFLLVPIFGFYIFAARKKAAFRLFRGKRRVMLGLFFLLLIPTFMVIRHGSKDVFNEVWQISAGNIWRYFNRNIGNNISLFFNPLFMPVYLPFLVILGGFIMWRKDKAKLAGLIMAFACFFMMFTVFANGFLRIDGDNLRYTIVLFIPLVIIGAAGAGFIFEKLRTKTTASIIAATFLILMILVCSMPGMSHLLRYPYPNSSGVLFNQEYEFILDMEDRLPSDVYIIAANPASLISTINKKAVNPSSVIEDNSSRFENILFFKDFWFVYTDMFNEQEILLREKYDFEVLSTEGNFTFFNLTKKG